MVQLINKGGFRERANRSRKYAHSENHKTTLDPNRYGQKETAQSTEHPVADNTAPVSAHDPASSSQAAD